MTEVARLQSVLEHVLPDAAAARQAGAVCVHWLDGWAGAATVEAHGVRFRVVPAGSVLAVRAALVDLDEGTPAVLLTHQGRADLGADVEARIYQGRVFRRDRWDLLMGAFQARSVDPRLIDGEVAEALISARPAGGFSPAPGGVLDEDTAWAALCQSSLGVDLAGVDDVGLLRWALRPQSQARFARWSVAVRVACAAYAARRHGSLGALVFDLLQGARPAAPLVLWCDLAQRVPRGEREIVESTLRAAAGLEVLVPEAIERIGEALPTCDPFAAHGEAFDAAARPVERLLVHSPFSPAGLTARLGRFAAALDGPDTAAVWAAANAVEAHAGASAVDAEVVRMAARLHGWLGTEDAMPEALSAACHHYLDTTAWVDAARYALDQASLSGALLDAVQRLRGAAMVRREAQNEAFGRAVAAWTARPAPLAGVVPVEDALRGVVLGLPSKPPVLVLVMDGMPVHVARRLAEQIESQRWLQVRAPAETRALLSTVPSRTASARTSLLTGVPMAGTSYDETKAFRENVALKQANGGRPARLFVYRDLINDLSTVDRVVGDPEERVVGVVINTIDDELAGSKQMARRWDLEDVIGLKTVLGAARDANRVVVMTSDHGHVRHHPDTETRARTDDPMRSGERYRTSPDPVEAGEIEIKGPRVAHFVSEGVVVVPTIERLRYTTSRKAGYHGGVTPQEMVCPLVVLWPKRRMTDMPPAVATAAPVFWAPPGADEGHDSVERVTPPAVVELRPSTTADEPQGDLFAFAQTQVASLSGQLLVCQIFVERLRRSPQLKRHVELLGGLVDALADGHRWSLARLSQQLSKPVDRVRGLLSAALPLLNIDGYGVLEHDLEEDAARLDVALLRIQFELDP